MKETEVIDDLFLELSQFTSAQTAKERQLSNARDRMRELILAQTKFVCLHDSRRQKGIPVCGDCPLGGPKFGLWNACGLRQEYSK